MPDIALREFTPFPNVGAAEWQAMPQVHMRLRPFGEGGDDTAPVVTLVSPTELSLIAANTPLVVDVTDATTLRRVLLRVRFPSLRIREVIYEEGGFAEIYSASSVTQLGSGFRFTIARDGGWPPGEPIELKTYAFDLDGNEA